MEDTHEALLGRGQANQLQDDEILLRHNFSVINELAACLSRSNEHTMSIELPAEFADLQPFADKWAAATEYERATERRRSTPAELRAFYDAVAASAGDPPLRPHASGAVDGGSAPVLARVAGRDRPARRTVRRDQGPFAFREERCSGRIAVSRTDAAMGNARGQHRALTAREDIRASIPMRWQAIAERAADHGWTSRAARLTGARHRARGSTRPSRLAKVARELVVWSFHAPSGPLITLADDVRSAKVFWWVWIPASLRDEQAGRPTGPRVTTTPTGVEDGRWKFQRCCSKRGCHAVRGPMDAVIKSVEWPVCRRIPADSVHCWNCASPRRRTTEGCAWTWVAASCWPLSRRRVSRRRQSVHPW
jgi:hypothetical protein